MKISMRDTGPRISDLEIARLERKIGFRIPDEYRAFLMEHNGGRPTPKFFSISACKEQTVGQILDFFGIGDPLESCRLDWNFDVFLGRMPPGLFPIACEDGGNIICLSLGGAGIGSVYYWDHEEETSPPGYGNVYKISDSFGQFLDDLHDCSAEQ